jgi:hypothetical protein
VDTPVTITVSMPWEVSWLASVVPKKQEPNFFTRTCSSGRGASRGSTSSVPLPVLRMARLGTLRSHKPASRSWS